MTLRVTPTEIVQMAEASGWPGLLVKAPGWSRVRLGDVARVVNGAAYPSTGFNVDQQGMPLIRIRDVGADSTSTWFSGEWDKFHLVRYDDILVGMDGDFRVARWRSKDGLLNQRVCRIDVDPDRYDYRFLTLALQGYLDAIWSATSSTTVKHLSSRTVADIPLPGPPLDEQRRIAAILEDHLSRLDAADATLMQTERRLRAFTDHVIAWELVGRGGQANASKAAEGNPLPVEDERLAKLPGGWSWRPLGELADVVGGVTKDSRRQSDPATVEVPYLRVANVQKGRLDLTNVSHIRVSPSKASTLRLRPGDVLMNEGGDRDKLARGWVWDGQIDNCIHQNHVFRARVRDNQIEPRLLSWATNTLGGKWAERNARQSVNLASISLSTIRRMPVPVPAPADQDRIVQRVEASLEAAERLQTALRRQRQASSGLRRSLLAAAFSGLLTSHASDMARVEETA